MVDMEQENATYRETLAQFQGKIDTFQGNMNTVLKYIQAQKATTSYLTVVVTDLVVFTTSVDVVEDTVIQPMVSQPICQSSPSRHDVAYP